jgi:hypothetical protein
VHEFIPRISGKYTFNVEASKFLYDWYESYWDVKDNVVFIDVRVMNTNCTIQLAPPRRMDVKNSVDVRLRKDVLYKIIVTTFHRRADFDLNIHAFDARAPYAVSVELLLLSDRHHKKNKNKNKRHN